MGAPLLRVNGFDFSAYINVQHDDGLDPLNPDRKTPQFSGSSVFREGKAGAGQSVDNRAWTVPLVLEAANRAALHDLVRQANAALVKGAMVEFAIDSTVDPTSYFTLENGRLDPAFQYYLSVNSVTRATLRLWSTPHATTGTQRLLASVPMGSSAVLQFPATGVRGDEEALANIEVRVGSAPASAGRVVLYGMHPHPSFLAYRPATSGLAQTGATVRGASGAVGSQYTAIPVSPTGASGVAYRAYLDPPDAHVGRHRVFALGRSGLSQAIPLYAQDRFGAILGATALASQVDQGKWQMIDLGEVQVPARASGQDSVPTQYVELYGGGASGASVLASPGFHLNGLVFLPLDYSVGVLRTGGAAAAGGAFGDNFSRYKSPVKGMLETYPNSDLGEAWSKINGGIGGGISFAERSEVFAGTYNGTAEAAFPLNGATGLYALGSGAMRSDVRVALYGGLGNVDAVFGSPSKSCASARIILYPKMQPSAAYAKAVWSLGPSPYLAIISGASPGAENLRASAGMPSMIASGFLEGQAQVMTVQVLSGRMDVWIGTGPLTPSPVVSASHAELGIPGNLGLQMFNGTVGVSFGFPANYPQVTRIAGQTLAGSAADTGAREYFRFESSPESRVYQGNASAFVANRLANYRGHDPRLTPIGTGAGAQGPIRVVVVQGEIDNVVGNDGADVALTAMERWEYLR